jgi:hypothetical protein
MAHEVEPAAQPLAGVASSASVNLNDLTNQELPAKTSAREVTPPLVRVGLRLAIFVFSVICACTLAIFIIAFGFTHGVEPPGRLYYFDTASVDRYQRAMDLYKQVGDVPIQRAKELFQLFVITAFLPVFTAILGYIFGTRGGGGSNSSNPQDR